VFVVIQYLLGLLSIIFSLRGVADVFSEGRVYRPSSCDPASTRSTGTDGARGLQVVAVLICVRKEAVTSAQRARTGVPSNRVRNGLPHCTRIAIQVSLRPPLQLLLVEPVRQAPLLPVLLLAFGKGVPVRAT
jgi:hypothetical protein